MASSIKGLGSSRVWPLTRRPLNGRGSIDTALVRYGTGSTLQDANRTLRHRNFHISRHDLSATANLTHAPQGEEWKGLPSGWRAVIGVECHAQIKAKTKLFSATPLPNLASEPNILVSPFDAAHPGTLPQLELGALAAAIRASLFLHCEVQPHSRFDRKHYFYPDLPPGYQITQKYEPLATNGYVKLTHSEGYLGEEEEEVKVEIEQLQLEQDTAKSSHSASGDSAEASSTFVDLNRAGVGLMEIVSGPQLRTPAQAGAYIRKLQELLRRVGASDGNMEEGSLRCDINVSVGKVGEPFGTRCEVKNVNGVRFVMNAIAYETQRQFRLLSQGKEVQQQTRAYNEQSGKTIFLRSKEDAPDYRYMPDPNLPPIAINDHILTEFRRRMPEHPDDQRRRLIETYDLSIRDTNVLMRVGLEDDRQNGSSTAQPGDAVKYFEEVAKNRNPQTAANWVMHELMKALNARGRPFDPKALQTSVLRELIDLVEEKKVTYTSAKSILPDLLAAANSSNPASKSPVLDLLTSRGLLAMSNDSTELVELCRSIIQDLPKEAEKVRAGNQKVIMRMVGEAMKRTKGRANAKAVNETLVELLSQE
ncbi:unnamed protein product [Sympodiomycopsis kandeliae]